MDQHQHMQYMMWVKRKQIFKSHFQPINSFINNNNNSSSWEEQAFAEDAAGPLGGFTWPPRSYSCTFCSREFKSAQALGGHMNVHRRDRALLKQSSSLNHIETPPPNSPTTAGGDSGSSPYSSLSSTSTTILSPQNSTTKKPSSPQGSDTSNSGKFLSLSNQNFARGILYNNINKNVVTLDYNKDVVNTNLSIGLHVSYRSCGDKEESYYNISSSKRQRLIISNEAKSCVFPTEVVTRKAIDDNIDLELRL